MIEHLSHTQISMWLRCPRQWMYRYVEGIRRPASAMAVLGGACHQAIAFNYEAKCRTRRDEPLSAVTDFFQDQWRRRQAVEGEDSTAEEIDWMGEDPDKLQDQGIILVSTYHRNLAPRIQPVAVNLHLSRDVLGIPYVGELDCVDETGRILDQKTRRASISADTCRAEELQYMAYPWLCGLPDATVVYHYLVKTKVPGAVEISLGVSATDIAWYETRLLRPAVAGMLTALQSGDFMARPGGWWCTPQWCGYYGKCRGGEA